MSWLLHCTIREQIILLYFDQSQFFALETCVCKFSDVDKNPYSLALVFSQVEVIHDNILRLTSF